MFCPKCGSQNPETGKFCRGCGTDLGNVSEALSGKLPEPRPVLDRKGRPVSWEGAIVKLFTGLAFLVVSIALAFSTMGRGWWFWMLIPGFTSLGAGVAQYIQLRKSENSRQSFSPQASVNVISAGDRSALPPDRTSYVSPESRYKTGDLVPPSVAEGTTRHLDLNTEGDTMTLPKPPVS
jgi:hypothetical protein